MAWKRDESTPTDPTAGQAGIQPAPTVSPAGEITMREEIDTPEQLLDHMIVDFANAVVKGLQPPEDDPLAVAFGSLVGAYCQKYPESAIAKQVAAQDANV